MKLEIDIQVLPSGRTTIVRNDVIMRKNQTWSSQELNDYAKEYCNQLFYRVKRHRLRGDIHSMKTDAWDIPRVAVACSSLKAPYHAERNRNCSDLRNPHPTLFASYSSQRNKKICRHILMGLIIKKGIVQNHMQHTSCLK